MFTKFSLGYTPCRCCQTPRVSAEGGFVYEWVLEQDHIGFFSYRNQRNYLSNSWMSPMEIQYIIHIFNSQQSFKSIYIIWNCREDLEDEKCTCHRKSGKPQSTSLLSEWFLVLKFWGNIRHKTSYTIDIRFYEPCTEIV